ncbi:hypothetical protein BDZ89DRAFT_1084569 [Hymenopellis radicata]|nr:hypothetical protein BDZ89DRAFT_1084569 [Hymenopellis radicata]
MDDYSYAMPPQYYSQPMELWYHTEAYSVDAARALEDRLLPRDPASFTPTQLDPSHAMNLYPSLPISAERALEYHPFPKEQPLSFLPANGFPAADPPNIERGYGRGSESEPEDYPLPADAARWISMSPTQFDKEYPGGNPFVFDELNLDSEEDPENASYVELDGVRELNRILVIFWAVEHAILLTTAVLADLLQEGKVWLWVDGDEEKCADLHWDGLFHLRSLKYLKQKFSCSSLRLRKPRSPTWTSLWERVSKASFAMRVLAITWATFTCLSVREAGWARGRADWTRCALFETVSLWYFYVFDDLGIPNLPEDESWHSYLEVAFKDTLQHHGHSCNSFPKYPEEALQLLLYLQSFLHSTPSRKDVSMIWFDSDSDPECSQCRQCNKLYAPLDLCIQVANNDAPVTSLRYLSLFSTSCGYILRSPPIDTAAWLSVVALGLSRDIISAAILSKMDDEIRQTAHLGTNELPSRLRCSVVECSESEWREAELAVRRENQDDSVPTSPWDSMDIGLGVRITAIYLFMSEHSSRKLTPRKYWLYCHIHCCLDVFDDPVYPAHISASVEAFCDATSQSSDASTHTCCEFSWDILSLKFRQCYAAAYLLLHPESQHVPLLEPLRRPVSCANNCSFLWDKCLNCQQCRKLPEAEPLVPTQITASDATIPPADGMDDSVPMSAVVRPNSPVSISASQIPSTSGQSRASTLPKDVILPKLKTHFAKLLIQHDIPIQYTNLGAPQLPWCTLPELLRNRHLEIAGWPEDLPLPDATEKHNAKGIMGLTAKDARRLYEALPGISFRRMDKARARPRPREEESEDDIGNRPTKKAKGKGKAPAEGEWKFRLSEVQSVIMRVGKSN